MTKLLSNLLLMLTQNCFFSFGPENRNLDILKDALKSKSRSYLQVPN